MLFVVKDMNGFWWQIDLGMTDFEIEEKMLKQNKKKKGSNQQQNWWWPEIGSKPDEMSMFPTICMKCIGNELETIAVSIKYLFRCAL